jgi:hypothetical protein
MFLFPAFLNPLRRLTFLSEFGPASPPPILKVFSSPYDFNLPATDTLY